MNFSTSISGTQASTIIVAAIAMVLRPYLRAPSEGTKGQTLRLNMAAWRELKILAIEQGQPAHALLVEAVNDLFRKYGKKPSA